MALTFNDNFNKLMKALLANNSTHTCTKINGSESAIGLSFGLKSSNFIDMIDSSYYKSDSYSFNPEIVFGSGNPTNYSLGNMIFRDSIGVYSNPVTTKSGNINKYTGIFQNKSTESISISEIGLYQFSSNSNSGGIVKYPDRYIMIASESLETGIEVPAGEYFSCTVQLDFS